MGRGAGAGAQERVCRERGGQRLGAGRRGGEVHEYVTVAAAPPVGRGVGARVRAVGDGDRAGDRRRAAGPGDADVDGVAGVDRRGIGQVRRDGGRRTDGRGCRHDQRRVAGHRVSNAVVAVARRRVPARRGHDDRVRTAGRGAGRRDDHGQVRGRATRSVHAGGTLERRSGR